MPSGGRRGGAASVREQPRPRGAPPGTSCGEPWQPRPVTASGVPAAAGGSPRGGWTTLGKPWRGGGTRETATCQQHRFTARRRAAGSASGAELPRSQRGGGGRAGGPSRVSGRGAVRARGRPSALPLGRSLRDSVAAMYRHVPPPVTFPRCSLSWPGAPRSTWRLRCCPPALPPPDAPQGARPRQLCLQRARCSPDRLPFIFAATDTEVAARRRCQRRMRGEQPAPALPAPPRRHPRPRAAPCRPPRAATARRPAARPPLAPAPRQPQARPRATHLAPRPRRGAQRRPLLPAGPGRSPSCCPQARGAISTKWGSRLSRVSPPFTEKRCTPPLAAPCKVPHLVLSRLSDRMHGPVFPPPWTRLSHLPGLEVGAWPRALQQLQAWTAPVEAQRLGTLQRGHPGAPLFPNCSQDTKPPGGAGARCPGQPYSSAVAFSFLESSLQKEEA